MGLLTGLPGVGKTAALRALTAPLNPHRYLPIYLAETDFGRLDIYRSHAWAIGLDPPHRRAALWREIKARLIELVDQKNLLPVWIIDEAQNLPNDFFRDFPAFLNFAFGSRDLMTVWLVAQPVLAKTLDRALYEPMASRLQVRVHLDPIDERDAFRALIDHALAQVGCQQRLLSDSGLEILRMASQGRPRQAGLILRTAMKLAVPPGTEPPARRPSSRCHRGPSMKDTPHQLPLILPPGLDDDTVLALWSLLNDVVLHFESVYFVQLQRACDARQPPRNPEKPWLPLNRPR